MLKLVMLMSCASLALAACTRDTSGATHFDPDKACKALVLANPTIEAAKHTAIDAGAKPGDVDKAATAAHDLAEFAAIVCAASTV